MKTWMSGCIVAALLLAGCAAPGPVRQGGFSAERVAALEQIVAADVNRGRIPGVVMAVQRDGKPVFVKALGQQDPARGAPMREDAIFRIYSMSKPIVSAAAMMLVEEAKLSLSDPVSKHIPELKAPKVGVEKDGKLELVPALREPTVQDLLRHTSGYTYQEFGRGLVKDQYKAAGVTGTDHTNAEFVRKLATVPLMFQPATTWEYSRSTEVLGHVIERVSGQALDVFLQTRIFGPLGMKDTGFSVEPAKHARIAEPFAKDPDTGAEQSLLAVRTKPKFLAGGQGLVSTAADYLRFAQMLLNGGELDGVRLLSRKTVEYMTSDHLGTIRYPGAGYGFGLGFAVRHGPGVASSNGSDGDYNWAGLGGTYFWVDPKERLVAVWMAQAPGSRNHYRDVYRNLVYGALVGE